MARAKSVKEKFETFLGVKNWDEGVSYRLDSDKEKISAWVSKASDNEDPPVTSDEISSEDDQADEPSLSEDMKKLVARFTSSMSAFHSLSSMATVMGTTFRIITAKNEIEQYAQKHCEKLKDGSGYSIYGVPAGHTREILKGVQRSRQLDAGLEVLPGAIILSLAAVYDNYMSELVARMLRQYPARFEGKSINVKDIMAMDSLSDVVDKVIDDEIDGLMRKSHSEQIKFIEDSFSVSIKSHYERWANYIEFFERRNIVAHGNTLINRHYIKNCNDNGFKVSDDKIGDRLDVGGKYIARSTDMLIEFGLLAMFSIWRKAVPDDAENVFKAVNQTAYELIVAGRPRLASQILDFAVNKQTAPVSEMVRKMLVVNLASAYRKFDEVEKSEATLKKFDWETSADRFQICVAAIRGNADRVIELMSRVSADIGKEGFREWPAFDNVRDNASFTSEFERIFGEPPLASVANVTAGEGGLSA